MIGIIGAMDIEVEGLISAMSNKEEKSKEHKKKNKYIVKDKDGNILPIDIPDEFMDGLRAMLKEEQEKVKNRGRDPLK